MMRWLLLVPGIMLASATPAYEAGCLGATAVPLRVRIGDQPLPVEALLQGGSAPALAVVDRTTGRLLWSADAMPPATQLFAAMRGAFAGSLSVLDLDGDGLHDRIYAGDLAGRLWRFDLHHGNAAPRWATGGVFADFSNLSGRGFVAAPDVSLAAPAGAEPWFNIAVGTAAPGDVATRNRYYVLRDHAPFKTWQAEDFLRWRPLHEEDLLRLAGPRDAPDEPIGDGYYIELGRGEVLSASITVAGRAVLAIADSAARTATHCAVAVTVATLQVDTATAHGTDGSAAWLERLPGVFAAGSPFLPASSAEGGILPCLLGNQRVAACDVDSRPVRTWWRREDAE